MGNIWTLIRQCYPPSPTWSTDLIPDLAGKVILITGGNSGIGKETARVCLTKGATVYIACRSADKAHEATTEIQSDTGRMDVHFLALDLSNLKSVKASAEEFMRRETRLDVLYNNAGVMMPPADLVTEDGYDLQFGTNVLGHYYFTTLLMPLLLSTAKISPEEHVRVVNVSSGALNMCPSNIIDWNTLKGTDEVARAARARFGGPGMLYPQSKAGNVLFSNELAKRYADKGIVSIAIHPGGVYTNLTRTTPSIWKFLSEWILNFQDVKLGALTQLYAGTATEAASLNGKYLIPYARLSPVRHELYNQELALKLWDWCAEQVAGV